MKLKEFTKMHGAGNDFIMIDNRKKIIKDVKTLARKLCPRHIGVGADGLILIENSKKASFKMRIINADGSEAEMCGNGARCAVSFAKSLGIYKRGVIKFETLSGLFAGEETKRGFKIYMADPFGLKTNIKLNINGVYRKVHFINTGVPHTVVFVKNINDVPIVNIGRTIRYHKLFSPAGTNVNFVSVNSKTSISVRTYERGVENETLACGTGSVASACISYIIYNMKQPVRVKTKSGDTLYIGLKYNKKEERFYNVTMEGSAKTVYHATLI